MSTYAVDHYVHVNGAGLTLGAVRTFTTRNDQLEQLDKLRDHWRRCGYAVTFPAAGFTVARDTTTTVRGAALARDTETHPPIPAESIMALSRRADCTGILGQVRKMLAREVTR